MSAADEKGGSAGRILAALVLLAVLIGLDQWVKHLATGLKTAGDIRLIPGVFVITYAENTGAAFSILEGRRVFFLLVTALLLAIVLYAYLRLLKGGKAFKPLRVLAVCIAAGGIGNLIDRLRLGYVVDMFYIELIRFPVFNVADCCITVSAAVLLILLFTVYKDTDFSFLSPAGKGGE